jgi:hypothetical protein
METIQAGFDHQLRENPIGEARKDALRLDFDRRLKLEFHGTKITSDAGLLACRELDEALGLTSVIDSELRDIRKGKNTQHGLTALFRGSIYSRLAGYDDTNDAERLAVDPAMRHVAGGRAIERSAASLPVIETMIFRGSSGGMLALPTPTYIAVLKPKDTSMPSTSYPIKFCTAGSSVCSLAL